MEREGFDLIGKHADARTMQCAEYGAGIIVGYSNSPQVLIRRPDGAAFWWRVDLCSIQESGDIDTPQE